MIKKIFFLISVIVFIFSFNGFAADMYGGYNIPIDIDINGSFIKCVHKPIMIDNVTYIPLRVFSDAVGGAVSWDEKNRAAIMTKSGHTFSFYPGQNYCMADGVKKNYGSVIYKDLTFIPIRAVSEVLGYGVEWDDFYLTVKITASGITVPENLKDKSYTYEDILYLSKMTHIECGYEHFDVKLGVADVIVNRVKSPLAPDTVKEVILDKRYGVQFPPAHTDKINVTPSKESIIASKCALNGANIVGEAFYFIDKKSAPNSWVHKNRPFNKTIHSMSFYN